MMPTSLHIEVVSEGLGLAHTELVAHTIWCKLKVIEELHLELVSFIYFLSL